MIWLIVISILIPIVNVYASTSIGVNMGALRDWNRSLQYVNLIKQSRTWGSPSTPWDGNVTFDPISGWPTKDFGVILATNDLDTGWPISKETKYFFDFYLIDRRLDFIFIPHILGDIS
jgi:hypothetical protein